MKGWTTPGPDVAVSERTLIVSVDLELVGEHLTPEELEAVLDRPETEVSIVAGLREELARGFGRSRTVGWHEDGNRWVEMVGVTEARVLVGPQRLRPEADDALSPRAADELRWVVAHERKKAESEGELKEPKSYIAENGLCKHGHPYFCGLCEAESAPKCKHGHPWHCGHCGRVLRPGEAR